MTIMQEKEAIDKKIAVQSVCTLLFPKHKVMFTPRSVLLSGESGSIMIDENNFEAIQQVLKNIFCLSNSNNQQAGFNPANEKAREIAEKLIGVPKNSMLRIGDCGDSNGNDYAMLNCPQGFSVKETNGKVFLPKNLKKIL